MKLQERKQELKNFEVQKQEQKMIRDASFSEDRDCTKFDTSRETSEAYSWQWLI
jgi:hypothetical protein